MTSTSSTKITTLPTVLLVDYSVILRQRRLVAQVPDECYWFGFVRPIELDTGAKYLYLYDMAIPEQEVSGGSVDLEATVNELMEELAGEDKLDYLSDMRFFAHSHANFGVFHSGVDQEQISDWAHKMNTPWFISHVQNKKGEMTTRLDMYEPFRLHVDDLRLEELAPQAPELNKWVDEEVQAKVKKKEYSKSNTSYGWTKDPNSPTGVRAVGNERMPLETGHLYNTAWEHYIRVVTVDQLDSKGEPILDKEKKPLKIKERQRIVDGYIFEKQNIQTGETSWNKIPSMKEREEKREALGIQKGVRVTGRKAQPDDKPGKPIIHTAGTGKAAARAWREQRDADAARDTSSQTHGVRTHGRKPLSEQDEKQTNSSDSESESGLRARERAIGQLLLPPGEEDEVYSDEEAADFFYGGGRLPQKEVERITELLQTPVSEMTDDDKEYLAAWELLGQPMM